MILELHERDTEVLEQILSILKNHPEIEKFEIDEEPMVSLPGLEIFPSRRKVFRDRQEIQLTAKEYRILLLLAANKGRVLTYAQIYEQVWGDFTTGNENNTIGFHMIILPLSCPAGAHSAPTPIGAFLLLLRLPGRT